jgi:hypothetical protein
MTGEHIALVSKENNAHPAYPCQFLVHSFFVVLDTRNKEKWKEITLEVNDATSRLKNDNFRNIPKLLKLITRLGNLNR